MMNKSSKICPHCHTYNAEGVHICCICKKKLGFAILECITSSCNIKTGASWLLSGVEHTIGSSENCDLVIDHPDISPVHFKLVYDAEEKVYHYVSLSDKRLSFEKQKYKVLEGAVIPLSNVIEFKLSYIS